jgi:hypothetical protein
LNIEQRVQVLEEELNIMKNDIKPILLDIREQYLNMQNPFNDSILKLEKKSDQHDTGKPDEEPVAPSTGSSPALDDSESNTKGTLQEDKCCDDDETISSDFEENDLPGLGPDSSDLPHYSSRNSKEKGKKQHQSYQFDAEHKADVIMIAGLAQWIEEATYTLGKDRVEALMEMASAMGRLPVELKDVIIKLARLSKHEDAASYPITSKDYLALLTQLENLLGHSQPNEIALLSILSMMKETISG